MDPHTSPSELSAFGEFIHSLNAKGTDMTADEAVVAFREYQSELQRFKSEVKPGLLEYDSGLAAKMDVHEILERAKQRLADEEIHD